MTCYGEPSVRISVPIRAVITASFAAAITAGLLAAPVWQLGACHSGAGRQQPGGAHAKRAGTSRKPGRLPLPAAQLRADQRRLDAAQGTTSSLTGLARTAAGAPLAAICVTAYGPAGAKAAVTDATAGS